MLSMMIESKGNERKMRGHIYALDRSALFESSRTVTASLRVQGAARSGAVRIPTAAVRVGSASVR